MHTVQSVIASHIVPQARSAFLRFARYFHSHITQAAAWAALPDELGSWDALVRAQLQDVDAELARRSRNVALLSATETKAQAKVQFAHSPRGENTAQSASEEDAWRFVAERRDDADSAARASIPPWISSDHEPALRGAGPDYATPPEASTAESEMHGRRGVSPVARDSKRVESETSEIRNSGNALECEISPRGVEPAGWDCASVVSSINILDDSNAPTSENHADHHGSVADVAGTMSAVTLRRRHRRQL